MTASPQSSSRREWASRAAWAVSGVVLAVIVFELLDLRSDEERIRSLLAAVRRGNLAEVRELVDDGIDLGAVTPNGWTALHHAAFHGRADIVALLLENGAPVAARHPRGWTPLHRAAEHGSIEVARMLIERGAPIDAEANGRSALGVAIAKGHKALVGYLVDQGAGLGVLEERSGLTPLLYAVMSGDLELLEKLLAREASVDARLSDGESALHIAVALGDADGVALLLKGGAKPNARNATGRTPLHRAATSGPPELVAMLLEFGADPAIADESGQRPLDLVPPAGSEAIAELLEARGD